MISTNYFKYVRLIFVRIELILDVVAWKKQNAWLTNFHLSLDPIFTGIAESNLRFIVISHDFDEISGDCGVLESRKKIKTDYEVVLFEGIQTGLFDLFLIFVTKSIGNVIMFVIHMEFRAYIIVESKLILRK